VRNSGSMARRLVAGAFLAAVMTLALAGIASAQSGSGSGSGGGTSSTTTTTIKTIKGGTLGRTGINAGILLIVGGGLTVAVLGARRLARASATD